MRSLVQFLLALFCVAFAFASETAGSVKLLTGADFDGFIKEHPISLIKFMAPWCGHCKKLAPEYEGAAAELVKAGSIPLAEVDATQDSELAKKYGVQGFPTMFLFRDGTPEPYTGGRTKAAIVEWVKKMTGPAVEWLNSQKEIAEKTADKAVAFVAHIAKKDDASAKLFDTVAQANRMKGSFYALVDSSIKEPKVNVHRTNEEVVSTNLDSVDKLTVFVQAESVPYLGPIGGENYAQYAGRSQNWVWFAANNEDYQKYGEPIRKVSKNYRTEFNFVWLDTDSLKHHAEAALGLKEFPSIAVVWEDSKFHFGEEIAEKSLTKFIESVKAGKVKKFLKSEAVPEKNDEAVKVIVGSQFSEMVLRKDKDVFLKIYAPWCGHCKKIAPIWDELAEKTKGSKNFMVAKFDGTANEPDVSGFDYHGFPTLYFVKAGSKTPIAYDGDRTLEGLLAFAKKTAVHLIVVSESSDDNKDEL